MIEDKERKLLVTVFIIIVVMAIISIAGIIFFRVKPEIIQGRIEAGQITISGKLLGRINSFYVKEGEHVEKGDTLVRINSPEAYAQFVTASAMENVAIYQNRKIDSGTRDEIIKSLKQVWEAAKANSKLAASTMERSLKLFADSIITPQRMEEVETLYKSAQSAEKAAYYEYLMAKEGAQAEDRESARAMVNAAKGGVMAVEAVLSDSQLTAPESGEIGSIYPSEGELVMPGTPIMEIVVTDSCYAVINVKEEMLPHFKMGSNFKAIIPALSNAEILFKVYYMSPLGSFANWQSSKEGNMYNIVTFRIKGHPIKVLSPANADSGHLINELRPGMSVLVEIS